MFLKSQRNWKSYIRDVSEGTSLLSEKIEDLIDQVREAQLRVISL